MRDPDRKNHNIQINLLNEIFKKMKMKMIPYQISTKILFRFKKKIK